MKTIKSIRLTGINIAIYVFLLFLSIAAISKIWKLTKEIYYPLEAGHLSIPRIISPANNVFVTLNESDLKNDPLLYKTIHRNAIIYDTIKDLIFIVLFFMVILELKTLLSILKKETFFIEQNLNCVRKISYLLGIWVIIDFILYQCFQFFIPLNVIQENWNYLPINKNIIAGLLLGIEFSKLLAAFAFYIISVVFREGYQLKEQSDLTI